MAHYSTGGDRRPSEVSSATLIHMNDELTREDIAEAGQALRSLQDRLQDCQRCALSRSRTRVVFGTGHPRAELLLVGEGPGFNEDRQGEPFVGQAGKLLTDLLARIGLKRQDVYITNVVKCRPPGNRDPAPEEIEACRPYLMEQIAIIRPRVVCTLGRIATKVLADTNLSITAVHGKAKVKQLGGVEAIVLPVFHPAAALYTPASRQALEEDFARLRRLLDIGVEALSSPAGSSKDAIEVGEGTDACAAGPEPEQLPLW